MLFLSLIKTIPFFPLCGTCFIFLFVAGLFYKLVR